MTTEWEYERLRAWRALKEQAVKQDQWDERTWARVHKAVDPLRSATKDLQEVLDTGAPLMADVFSLLHKAAPELYGREEMRPDSVLNHTVATETPRLSDYIAVRRYTRGDEVASALACVTMEPELETLADRARRRQDQAKALQDKLDELAAAMETKVDIDEMIERWTGEHPDEELPEDMAARRADAATDDLEGEVEQMAKDLEAGADADANMVRGSMALSLRQVADDARAEATLASALWGTEAGQLRRLPAAERMALARKLDNERLRKIIKKFGAIRNMALTDRLRSNPMMNDEIVGITLGRDLHKVIPAELAKLRDPRRRPEFYRDYADGKLISLDFDGTERAQRGAIIMPEDGSGSMRGEREHWAKALMMNMLSIARDEGRAFHLIHFGSAPELYPIDFSTPDMFTTERIFEAIELFIGGGTAFEEPLTMAAKRLRSEFNATGRVDGDIVMLTDGICDVSDSWLEWFQREQDELGFTVWGIIIGMPRESEPLWTICKGNVATVRARGGGTHVRNMLQGV